MRYQIDPDWLVDCDETSCQLLRLRTITGDNTRGRKAAPENIGKQREEGMGFYANLEQALVHGYLNKAVVTEPLEAATALQVVQAIEKAKMTVIEALRGWSKS